MQKYTIFTKYHSICITNKLESQQETDSKLVISCNLDNYRLLDYKHILLEEKHKPSIIIHAQNIDPSKVLFECIKYYHFVQASGGIVKNPKGEILFIYRNGKWDLPKGHKELKETIEEAAIREVEEECGINDIIIGEKARITYHTYFMKGKNELKETHWFYMKSNSIILSPQKEEGIEKAVWIKKENLDQVFSNTYLSIKDLLLNIDL